MSRFGRPSPGTVIACVALVFALAGTSIAASQIGKNDVGAKELAKVTQRSAEDGMDTLDDRAEVTVACKRKEQLLGGGATIPDADPASTDPPSVEQSGPIDKRSWFAVGHTDNDTVTLRATVLCLKK